MGGRKMRADFVPDFSVYPHGAYPSVAAFSPPNSLTHYGYTLPQLVSRSVLTHERHLQHLRTTQSVGELDRTVRTTHATLN